MRPGIPGDELGIVSDDAFFLSRMPERVILVGGGYIAVEFANIFAASARRWSSFIANLYPCAASTRICASKC